MPDDPLTQFDPRIETGSRASELPQEAHIRKRFEKFQDFIDMYRSRISLGGAFVDTDVLQPVGAEVYLDFRLEDGYRLLHGLGEVVWVRLMTMSDERPKGFGLRFLSLDEGGRELVLKLLEEQVKSGGAPFEVDRVPEDGSIDPTVVQALAGPSAEENAAAAMAKTGSRKVGQPESVEDDQELPDLPPGVLPPPDDESNFSAPWGERLPEIPTELLEESATGSSVPLPNIPAVEAPESPYAPGSDSHDKPVEAPPYEGDPHLDETDFGASAWGTSDDSASDQVLATAAAEQPVVRPLGEATNLQQAQGGEPFSDFDDDSVPEVDGTLFQLPDSSAEPAAAAGIGTADVLSSVEAPGFGGEAVPALDTSFDTGGGAFDVDFGDENDETASRVAPPPDIGDEVGRAWVEDAPRDSKSPSFQVDADAVPFETPAATPSSAFQPPPESLPPPPSAAETAAMDAALDIGEDDFASEPLAQDLMSPVVQATVDETADHEAPAAFSDAADIKTPAAIASAALTDRLADSATGPASQLENPTPLPVSRTETADDLFAFRGPPDAEPALDPEETASLRKGVLPDLSDRIMGSKAPSAEEGQSLQHSYDDWEEWAPHPPGSGGKSKVVLLGALLLVASGAGYFFRDTLLPMVGLDGGTATASGTLASAGSTLAGESTDTAEAMDAAGGYAPADDPLAEPVEVAQPDPIDPNGASSASDSLATSTAAQPPPPAAATEPRTTASAESLRPPPARAETTRSTGRAARRVEAIDVRPGSGATEVVVRFDGDVTRDRYHHDTLSWAPEKEIVKLLGMENFQQTRITGRGSHLRAVRVGFHPGSELHLVFDLTSEAVSIQGIEARGNQLVVRLSN